MKLIEPKSKIHVFREIPDLFDMEIENNIRDATAKIEWKGPLITPEMWAKVLSFFKWTYDKHSSESQVRLFVNPKLFLWDAWAFPQEERTGMSAREIENDESKKQRGELFKESEGWIYFGTVHHHCSSGAFQSGVDENNEKSQDGLHITVGKMNSNIHDIHCRFYIAGNKFEPDMSAFWDIGDEYRKGLPPELWDRVARWQMCQHVKTDFPKQWKDNVIDVRPASTTTHQSHNGYDYSHWAGGTGTSSGYEYGKGFWDGSTFVRWEDGLEYIANKTGRKLKKKGRAVTADILPDDIRVQNALVSMSAYCKGTGYSLESLCQMAIAMKRSRPFHTIADICVRHRVNISDLAWEIEKLFRDPDSVRQIGFKSETEAKETTTVDSGGEVLGGESPTQQDVDDALERQAAEHYGLDD